MDEWRLSSKGMAAGGFKWRADEYYARGSNKPKHMYSPDWVQIEIMSHAQKARPQGPPAFINPLQGVPPPKPTYGFWSNSNPGSPPVSPTASQLWGQTMSVSQAMGMSRRPQESVKRVASSGLLSPSGGTYVQRENSKQGWSSPSRAQTPPGTGMMGGRMAFSTGQLPDGDAAVPKLRAPQQVVQAWG
eukprot:TRINITY_DN91071_c0_g1_i1.p1 TRINITY_DN91071_c0_g1~~TRINITY_DN91071_c0_g1_i1.p1  ORF type:complete len:188 (-),score=34.93 TRINITY_DN91071_c0_g1_i1:146-709(-)